MNREQWNAGRQYEKIPEPKMDLEMISPNDPRWEEMLLKDNIVVIDNSSPPKMKLV